MLFDLDFDIVSRNTNWKALHSARRRRAKDGAGLHVETRTMPGARDDLALQFALRQGTSDMSTPVFDGTVLSVHHEERNSLAIRFDKFSISQVLQFGLRSDLDKFGHENLLRFRVT